MSRWGLLLGACLLVITALFTPGVWGQPDSEDLIQRLGCRACHALQGKGGAKGPAWDQVGSRLTSEAIKKQLTNPRGRMPNYKHLRPEELDLVVQYLSGLK